MNGDAQQFVKTVVNASNLTQVNPEQIATGEYVLIVDGENFQFGEVTEDVGRMDGYYYENITLYGENILTRKFYTDGHTSVNNLIAPTATVYAGYMFN